MSSDLLFDKCVQVLTQIHTDMPDLRFGEVVQNALDSVSNQENVCFSQVSTKQVLQSLEKYYVREKRKRGLE